MLGKCIEINVLIQRQDTKTSVIHGFNNDLEDDVNWTIINFANEKKTAANTKCSMYTVLLFTSCSDACAR